ncbi:hypothetical protein [Parasitella parasitica]|uniref:Uncharacterized protein n=1 Tax=Parasitella parasitica TaxID=35722 RepID=A0A0B7N0F2_9FUNG|nr:hypothetical protein [Parasitella parasitica]
MYQEITESTKRFNEASSRKSDPETLSATVAPEEEIYLRTIEHLRPLLASYPSNYKLQNDSIYYDVKARPERYFKTFLHLAKILGGITARGFSCLHLKTSWIPSYVTIDSKILLQNIIEILQIYGAESSIQTFGYSVIKQ